MRASNMRTRRCAEGVPGVPHTISRFAVVVSIVTLGTFAGLPAHAQLAEGGARSIGMGRTGVAVSASAWSMDNPAGWARLAERRVALEASQAYGLSAMRLGALSAAVPTSIGVAALSARTYGFDAYRETRIAAGFARSMPLSPARTLDVGLALGYDGLAIAEYGSTGTVLLSAGVQGEVAPRLWGGLAARHLLGIGWDEETDLRRPLSAVPSVAAGLAYAPSETALLTVDAVQDLDAQLSVRAGVEVRPVEVLALRAGVGTAPVRASAGIGVIVGPLQADVAVERHESLGLTPAVSLETRF